MITQEKFNEVKVKWLATGDTHADFSRFYAVQKRAEELDEYYKIIILGDAGLNFWLSKRDDVLKKRLHEKYPRLQFYCIRGNHEQRPELVDGMEEVWDDEAKGRILWQPKYPNIRYFRDGSVYEICGRRTLVLGGAYSVDKDYRLAKQAQGLYGGWFEGEQLTEDERKSIEARHLGKHFDLVLAHTCPYRWEPRDLFLSFIDQSKVDKTMEIWLDNMLDNVIHWGVFLCGHFHDDRTLAPRAQMLYTNVYELEDIMTYWS